MRYKTAVGKLRTLAGACEVFKSWPPDHPLLQAAYTFGDVLSGTDPLEAVQGAGDQSRHPRAGPVLVPAGTRRGRAGRPRRAPLRRPQPL